MNTLKYKGYIGSVAYSEPDKVFFGKIEGIDGLVNYEGESVEELTAAFHEAVDDYLIFCEEHNCKPDKSYSGAFNVRVAPNVHRKIANRASEEGISINAFVKKVLTEAVGKPSAIPEHYMDYFDSLSPEPAMLMDSGRPAYGRCKTVTLRVPEKDAEFIAELAVRMGWELV